MALAATGAVMNYSQKSATTKKNFHLKGNAKCREEKKKTDF